MKHETIESIGSYLDREVDEAERAHIGAHLAACPACSSIQARLERATAEVAGLPEIPPTPDELRKIRMAVVESRRPSLRRLLQAPQAWLAAGALALLVAGGVGVALFLPGSRPASETAFRQGGEAGPPVELQSPEETRDVVLAISEVSAGVGRYRVADVGTRQEQATQALAPEHPGAPEEDAAKLTAEGEVPLSSCLRSVLQSQPYPMMPIVARSATYQERPAWLLVYAWTSSSEDEARLDRLQIWVVDRQQCFPLSYQALRP